MPAPLDVTGERYGKLTAIRFLYSKNRRRIWEWQCDCGETVERYLVDVRRYDRKSVRSCGCDAKWFREGYKSPNSLPYGESSFRSLYARYQNSARIRGINWHICKNDMRDLTSQQCHYCGALPGLTIVATRYGTNGEYIYNGIDRIDNDGPYSLDNLVPCCKTCNLAKRSMAYDEFLEWIERAYRHSHV